MNNTETPKFGSAEYFRALLASNDIPKFVNRELALKNAKRHYPIGIKEIDDATRGGFVEGLSVMYAIPSAGKTAFLGQFAYKTALTSPVLIFELEMNRDDIETRWLTMQTYLNDPANTIYAVSTDKLTSKPFIENASDAEWAHIEKAGVEAEKHLKNIYVVDASNGQFTADRIKETVDAFVKMSPVPPVVIVDSIQYIPSSEKTMAWTEKKQLDYSLHTLADLAHKYRLLVFAVSTMTKNTFSNKQADFEALCGSNLLSYGADNIYSLSFHNTDDIDAERRKVEREVDFTLKKSRNSGVGDVVNLIFRSQFMHFSHNSNPTKSPEKREKKDKASTTENSDKVIPIKNSKNESWEKIKPEDTPFEQLTIENV